ncbi:MAG: LAGLIDADG family homing endonuclease [Candidatus Aenigmarchaeota archaeon]|nr:LAGLIDADG family homing endonuclease [Candidatus Aenigmarchaeota archaeon]
MLERAKIDSVGVKGNQDKLYKRFFDAEGGISKIDKKDFLPKDIRIYICQANKQSLDELKNMIQEFGIRTGDVCGPYFKKGYEKPTYGLMIHGIKNVNSFSKIIGSLHPEKLKRFEIIQGLKTPSGR